MRQMGLESEWKNILDLIDVTEKLLQRLGKMIEISEDHR